MSLIEELKTELEVLKLERDELNSVSADYEKQMEEVIENLKLEIKEYKENIITLEIKNDELESENIINTSVIKNLRSQNDDLIEKNVILGDEILSLKETIYNLKQR
ncbi:hypothetical protein TPHA_0B03610 [Tetrapisispora phaffii CBS 4417]|uniref:Uncharacterized protein n=1 Tax=Tetrapisispora phaffii (strain ATCC 24235 / CBS 4417 / NBRC 1672 / NRRL Y-8282 / UCD 70-5) TaxID=1071381 RepID=G8BPV0_TETPH|nr:hypothetical protein TPHA_0B03610 [Tetrapisispora phaffii CBS 4417]CCE62031.1 hypothetical protein TPHA_0B03610 [Tetrapisispora phaffii CBS 4417]